ncbi:CapA family protein [Legionella erythra]|uniref:Putative amino acid transporter n=1 Tax=Legionella erythra TaxID=448 RepID=A0A0W0TUB2_LEGER|nr:CapA family protein [Legionella erythra]KTC99100.1 putative amino acid transporter [Legionella erythra]
MKNNTTAYFRDLTEIQKKRIEHKESNNDSRLNQGTSWWWPPYTPSETWDYLKGFITTGASSRQNPKALLGKNTPTHMVGLENALIKHSVHTMNKPEDILVVGDVLFSKNGKTIVLGEAFKERIRHAKVMILNIESPVTSDQTNTGYGRLRNILVNGFKFSLYLPDSYLKALIEDIKKENPAIEIIYDVANNHTLDASTLPYEKMTPIEKSLYNFDRVNFPLYRTIYAIRHLIDPDAKIIGAWTHELEFKSFPTQEGTRINLQTEPVAVTSLNGLTIGFMALTDILNNNYALWKDGRAMRPEDVEGVLDAVKSHYHLDKFYILIHGGVEQNVYPSEHWQALLEQLAHHCDGVIGHGSHLPGLSQVLKTADSYVFIETSLGNFFCPTNPKNTAVSTLLTMKVTDESIQHIEEPIEALQGKGHPAVELLSGQSKSTYLGLRWFNLHKQDFSNVPQGESKCEKEESVQLTG